MLDGVLEADAGGGGVIGRILDKGCWLSIIDVIVCRVGGLPEILESELESSLSARWQTPSGPMALTILAGLTNRLAPKLLFLGNKPMRCLVSSMDHWPQTIETGWRRSIIFGHGTFWMVNIWRASLVIEGFTVSRCCSSRFMAYSKAPLFSAARKPVHPEPWIWMVDRKWRSTAYCHALNLVQPGSK